MKQLLILSLLGYTFLMHTVAAKTIEIDVHGMTCAFCVDSLERKFAKMKSIDKVQVSLKLKKVRLETKEDNPDIEIIKQAILDAGFTPIKVTVLPDANKQN